MRLPPQFVDSEAYFRCVVEFLRDYEWVYNFPVTKILVNGVLGKVPDDWAIALLGLTNDELNKLPMGLIKHSWPKSLIDFCQRCSALLSSPFEMPPCDVPLPDVTAQMKQSLSLSPKKWHELSTLATVINKECQSQGISTILDMGSGLGYVGQVLHHWYGFRVLGLEFDEARVKTAGQKQLNLCPRSYAVSYLAHRICPDSVEYIQEALRHSLVKEKREHMPKIEHQVSSSKHRKKVHDVICPGCQIVESGAVTNSSETLPTRTLLSIKSEQNTNHTKLKDDCENMPAVCMVGLHACGDLTVDAAEIYLRLPSVHSMILVPCCYHKMSLMDKTQSESNPSAECFRTFPASESLKRVFASTVPHPSTFLQRPFLRLAAQQSSSQWANSSEQTHLEKSMYVMARATLELLAHQGA